MKTFLLLLIVVVLFGMVAIFISKSFQYEILIEYKEEQNKAIFYKGKLFNYYVYGIRDRNPFNMKIVHLSKQKINSPLVVHNSLESYIVFFTSNTLEIFSTYGDFITSEEVCLENERIVSNFVTDVTNDAKSEILLITGNEEREFGESMLIYCFEGKLEKLYEHSLSEINPWKIQAADVDGDGIIEISLGVYKKAEFHPVMAKRPFLYSWAEDGIFPKWRGSRLSKPFEDYVFADIDQDGMDELISIEITLNGSKVINTYKWKGFGFESMSESGEFEDILSLRVLNNDINKVYARVKQGDDLHWISINYNNGRLFSIEKIDNYIERYIVE